MILGTLLAPSNEWQKRNTPESAEPSAIARINQYSNKTILSPTNIESFISALTQNPFFYARDASFVFSLLLKFLQDEQLSHNLTSLSIYITT